MVWGVGGGVGGVVEETWEAANTGCDELSNACGRMNGMDQAKIYRLMPNDSGRWPPRFLSQCGHAHTGACPEALPKSKPAVVARSRSRRLELSGVKCSKMVQEGV